MWVVASEGGGELLGGLQGGQLVLQGVDGGGQVLLRRLQLRHLLQHLMVDAGQVLSHTQSIHV